MRDVVCVPLLLAGLLPRLLLASLFARLGGVILSLVWIVSHGSSPFVKVEAHVACLQCATPLVAPAAGKVLPNARIHEVQERKIEIPKSLAARGEVSDCCRIKFPALLESHCQELRVQAMRRYLGGFFI